MDLFEKLKKSAKIATEKIDWDELNKRKDSAIEGMKHIKDDYETNQRQKKEDWIYKKEMELKEMEIELNRRNKSIKKEDWLYTKENELKKLENKLNLREKIIKKKETKLSQKFFLRFVLLAGGFSMIGVLVLVSIAPREASHKQKETASIDNNISGDKVTTRSASSNTYTPRERSVYGAYNDLNTSDPNFDLGGYCLKKEKMSSISFEECLAVSAAKLMSK